MYHVSLVNTIQLVGKYQKECGIQTIPDLFSPYPMKKRKKSGLAMQNYPKKSVVWTLLRSFSS